MIERRRVISLIVENRSGVLNRIVALLARRGFNIESISAAETESRNISLIIVVYYADTKTNEQIKKQLEKQIDVYELKELMGSDAVTREHVMVKIKAEPQERMELISVAGIFKASVIDVSPHSMIMEITGDENKTTAFIEAVSPYGVIQVARSGAIGMTRTGGPMKIEKKF